jgi:quercetin dioxygenase-like cupin family protein
LNDGQWHHITASMPAEAKSITDVSKHAVKLLSNDDFRVIKVALPPGKEIPQHFALNRLVYALDDGQVTLTDTAGKADAHDLKVGQTHFHPAGSSTLKNSGDTNISLLLIELKR